MISNKGTDYVISDEKSNLRGIIFKESNINPMFTACLPIMSEVCSFLQISELSYLTAARPTTEIE